MEKRTEWRGHNESQIVEENRSGRLVGAAKTSKEHAEWCRLQPKNLNKLGLLKRKEWPQCHRESSWQVCRNCLCQKEKEQSHLSRVPDQPLQRGGAVPDPFGLVQNGCWTFQGSQLPRALPFILLSQPSIDDLVFSVFSSNSIKLSYKISLLKYGFATLFLI